MDLEFTIDNISSKCTCDCIQLYLILQEYIFCKIYENIFTEKSTVTLLGAS